jgi:N-acetylglucosaminyldiphosphoundecaprenol N-acetyl-beta-D-mannosaminyltransferase
MPSVNEIQAFSTSVETLPLLNVRVHNLTLDDLLVRFTAGVLVTPNIDHLMKLQHHEAFYRAYQAAEWRVCDSRVIYLLQRRLFAKTPLKAQIAGSDFFPAFCRYHAADFAHSGQLSARIFLLGGTDESVVQAADAINHRHQAPLVVGTYSPPFGFEKDSAETDAIIARIMASGADTLAIGVGAPKQELWLHTHRHRLVGVKRFMAIGATIEFESGRLKRAPKWMTRCGIEWAYRLNQEPKRLARRYLLEDMPFFYLFLKQRLGLYRDPFN